MQYRKVLEKRKTSYEEQVQNILKEAEELDRQEDELYGDGDGFSMDRRYTAQEIRTALHKVQRKKKAVENQKKRIEAKREDVQGKIDRLGEERNSYGTTDEDATRMRIKGDYTGPGYNVQMASERQIIVAYALSQRCNDSHELQPMMKVIEKNLGQLPTYVITDKGYGTQKNYEYLRDRNYKGAAVPHQYYETDRVRLRKGTYVLSANIEYEKTKLKMMRFLNSELGQKLMKRRKHDIEPVFGDIKHNMGFRRFLLRGLIKTKVEIGLMAIAHNLKKIHAYIDSGAITMAYSPLIVVRSGTFA